MEKSDDRRGSPGGIGPMCLVSRCKDPVIVLKDAVTGVRIVHLRGFVSASGFKTRTYVSMYLK